MAVRLELKPEAFADIAEAFAWYEAQGRGLSADFEAQLGRTFGLLLEMPGAGRVVYRDLRRALLRRFPFAVYYSYEANIVEIRGVLHTSRHPRTWRRRA